MKLNELKKVASVNCDVSMISDWMIEEAILIREIEEKFLELFSLGKMNGTVHTCVGQEFSALAVAGQLTNEDWVTSNHRCHGHFISKTKNWQGLLDELMGLKSGVCKGIGSSQHLYSHGFLSNGPQAALVPVGTGIALHKKLNSLPGIVVSYIGEGTLGEGVLYEALNLASLYQVPQLIVCENNFYSQSTPQSRGVSGNILDRAKAFNVKTFYANTWDIPNLCIIAVEAINFVRSGKPAFFLIQTYRLNPHSKGDDNRDQDEVSYFRDKDILSKLLKIEKWQKISKEIKERINSHVDHNSSDVLSFNEYTQENIFPKNISREAEQIKNNKKRMVQALNQAYRSTLIKGAIHIGEDIEDPYGGAFKVTKGLSSHFPGRVFNTSISEAALVGIAIGVSMMGQKCFAEIMFGDFMTLTLDQILNNASKFHHMYAFNVKVPLRIRTPMGGKRGYGPTHSQSLEKHFLGIANVSIIALTSLLDPVHVIEETESIETPIILLENKTDYGRYLWLDSPDYELTREKCIFGALKLTHKYSKPNISVISYGETARHIANHLDDFFVATDLVPELICITKLHPLETELIELSVIKTRRVLIVEEGSIEFGFGAEILSKLVEKGIVMDFALRIGAESVPVPSIIELEMEVLPTIKRIIRLVIIKVKELSNV